MNLFYLAKDLEECSIYHCDKHIVKMGIETAQLASNVHYAFNSSGPYKKTHYNHPSSIWARSSLDNYLWTVKYGLSVLKEYIFRYGRIHATQEKLEWLEANIPTGIPDIGPTEFALAMPDYCKVSNDPILSYRNYYNKEKRHLFSWKKREVPIWIE